MKIQRQRETFTWRFARQYSPQEWDHHLQQVETALDHVYGNKSFDNRHPYGIVSHKGKKYVPTDRDRMMQYDKIFDILEHTGGPGNNYGALDIPRAYKALLMAGIGGAGKGTALNNPILQDALGFDLSKDNHFVINPDDIKQIMAHLGMIPDSKEIYDRYGGLEIPNWDELSPMERSPFVHEEASWLSKKFADRLRGRGTNIAYDGTLGRLPKAIEVIQGLRKDGYNSDNGGRVNATLVDASPETGLRRARERHFRGQQKWEPGMEIDHSAPDLYDLYGGRSLPASIHKENNPPPGSTAKSAPAHIFPSVSALSDSALHLNGDEDLPRDGSVMPQVISATGPDYAKLAPIALPRGRTGMRMTASEGAELQQILAEIQSELSKSCRGIIEDFKDGKIDYPTMASLIVQRVNFVAQQEHQRPGYYDHSEGDGEKDDDHFWLSSAVNRGFLTQEQMDRITDITNEIGRDN